MKNKISNGIIVLFAFVLGGLSMWYFSSKNKVIVTETGEKVEVTSKCQSCNSTVIMENGSLSASVEKTFNSTVMVKTFNNSKTKGSGSGFIYKIDGDNAYIITNHHVIDGGNKWSIINSDDEEIEGTVLGSDEYLDIAVIKTKKKGNMTVANILPSDKSVNLGDTVFTIGAPVGYEYRGTVTRGTLSGKNRMIEVSVASTNDFVMRVLQIDAAINPGNSGGPIVNIKGEVIGITSLKLVRDEIEGMGFAIPIEYAMEYVDMLEKGKEIERPYIGISMLNVTDTYRLYQLGITLDKDIKEGVVVTNVGKGSGADKAGLSAGDIITYINGSKITNAAYLKYELFKAKVGDTVEIRALRNGKEKTFKVTLTKIEN